MAGNDRWQADGLLEEKGTRMKIAVLQARSRSGQWRVNADTIRRAAQTSADAGAEVLVSPELFLSSYHPEHVRNDPGHLHRDELSDISAQCGLYLVGSTVEAVDNHRYISASLFGPDGTELTRYRKQHLFGAAELAAFAPGIDAPEVVALSEWRVALGICFDVEFPEFVRAVALSGADLLLVPTAVPLRPDVGGHPNPLDTRMLSTLVVPCRAYESQLFVAYANHSGDEFSGHSTIADPCGQRLATAGDGDELLISDLDHSRIALARRAVSYLDIVRAETAAKSSTI